MSTTGVTKNICNVGVCLYNIKHFFLIFSRKSQTLNDQCIQYSYTSIIRLSFLINGKTSSKYASPLFQRRMFYVKWFKYSHGGTVMEIAKGAQRHSQGYEFYWLAKDMQTY